MQPVCTNTNSRGEGHRLQEPTCRMCVHVLYCSSSSPCCSSSLVRPISQHTSTQPSYAVSMACLKAESGLKSYELRVYVAYCYIVYLFLSVSLSVCVCVSVCVAVFVTYQAFICVCVCVCVCILIYSAPFTLSQSRCRVQSCSLLSAATYRGLTPVNACIRSHNAVCSTLWSLE